MVAPRAGAWIETQVGYFGSVCQLSLPVRERGLKRGQGDCTCFGHKSLPVRERGLKHPDRAGDDPVFEVAPRAGAWIETWLTASR